MKIAVLSENTALSGFAAEYGLSMYVEKGSTKLLFDMGSYQAFMENAEKLDIDISSPSAIAFSHNHRDHCGGFLCYLEQHKVKCPVYVHTGFFRTKYWDHREDLPEQPTRAETVEIVGPPFDSSFVYQKKLQDFRLLPGDVFHIGDGIYLTGNFSIPEGTENVHSSSAMDDGTGNLVRDSFRDEQVCVIKTGRGLVVLTGCAHNGIMNILDTVEQRFGERIIAVIGGTHLLPVNEERIRLTAEYFNRKGIETAGVCHCTGEAGIKCFAESVTAYVPTAAGKIFELED